MTQVACCDGDEHLFDSWNVCCFFLKMALKVNISKWNEAAATLSFLDVHAHTHTQTAAESLLGVTLPTAIRETQCSLWGFTPPRCKCVCVCVCEKEREGWAGGNSLMV